MWGHREEAGTAGGQWSCLDADAEGWGLMTRDGQEGATEKVQEGVAPQSHKCLPARPGRSGAGREAPGWRKQKEKKG